MDKLDKIKLENLDKIVEQLAERQLGNCKFCKKYVNFEGKLCNPVQACYDNYHSENPNDENYNDEFFEHTSKVCKNMLINIIKSKLMNDNNDENFFFDLVNGSTPSMFC